MSATSRAVRIHRVGDLRVDDVEPRAASAGEAVVSIRYGGICGSDVHYWQDGAVGASVLKGPMILGHEVVGVVARAAGDGSGPAQGTAVAVHPGQTCGHCRFCVSGRRHLCPECHYLGSAAHWPHTDGGFTTRLVVEATRLVTLPAGLSLRRAVLAEPTSVAWHAVDRAAAVGRPVTAATVLVVGAGPVGLLLTAVALHRGAASVTVTDLLPRPLDIARSLGAHRTLRAAELADASLEADVVFESSGAPAGLVTALRAAARGGAVVVIGQLPRADIGTPAWLLPSNELTVTGSLRINEELPKALGFLADTAVDAIISHEFPLSRTSEAFDVAARADVSSKVVLRFAE